MLDKLIKFIEVDIGEELGGQVANWDTYSLSLSLSLVTAE